MAIYELVYHGQIGIEGTIPIARVFDTNDFRRLSCNQEDCRIYSAKGGEDEDDLESLAEKLIRGEDCFDSYMSGVAVTTIPAPVVISGDYNEPASIDQLIRFYKFLKEKSEIVSV